MKTWILSTGVALIAGLFYLGCFNSTNSINNKITFDNISEGDVYVNFRGSLIDVHSGDTTVVSDIPKGNYSYSITNSAPAGATSSTSSGAVAGILAMKAGTKIQFLFSSTLISGSYTLYVTESSSDSVSTSLGITLPIQNDQKTNTIITGP
jgi:hypothetical protein